MTNKQILYDDVEVTGSLTVRGSLKNAGISRVVSKALETAGTMQEIKGTVDGTSDYANDEPPTNNVYNLEIAVSMNTDGSMNVDLSWEYIQGEVKADGFLVFYKSDIDPPGPIDMNLDPAVFVAWTDLP